MEMKELYIKAVGFHKDNFEKTYQYVIKIQDQAEEKVIDFIEKAGFVPGPVKDVYRQWVETARKGRETLKKYADEGYQGIENYLATTA